MSEIIVVTETETEIVEVLDRGVQGPAGEGVPVGGTAGQVLTKDSGTDFDTSWQDVGAHEHAGEDITSGTVADARIAASIARDSEVTAAAAAAQAAAEATAAAALTAHLNDGSDAHDASAVSYAGGTGLLATDVEAAVDELANEKANTADAVMDGDAAGGVLGGTYPNPSFAADMATQAELDAHINDAADAHDASAISVDSTGLSGTATDVQGALGELDNLLDDHSARHEEGGADVIAVTAGIVDSEAASDGQILTADGAGGASWEDAPAGGAVAAEDVSIADAGNDFTATDVEGALAELQADHEADAQALADHIADPTAAHAASAISVSSATLSGTGTDVQAVFEEIDNLLDDHSARHENGGADEISIAGLDGTPTELANHLADATDAHDASAISIADAGNDFTATDVEGALAELQADHEADAQALADHIADATAAHAASAVSVSSATLSGTGTDVQAVFEEIDNLLDDHSARHENGGADEINIAGLDGTPTELTNHLNDATDAHDASAISVADADGLFTATEVEAALEEAIRAAKAGDLEIVVGMPGDLVAVGDGAAYARIPHRLNGHNLVRADAAVHTASASGGPILIQVHNLTQAADMLSTRINIDDTEKKSTDATTQPVIDAGNDDVATLDEIRIDVDDAGDGAADGLIVVLTFEAP